MAVKIQRPDIRKTIEVDLEIMLHLAMLLEKNIEEFQIYGPTKIVTEFEETLMKEIDYNNEAINIERFASQFLNEPYIYIPKPFPETTTTKVLTMEYIEGIKTSDIERLDRESYEKKSDSNHFHSRVSAVRRRRRGFYSYISHFAIISCRSGKDNIYPLTGRSSNHL